MNTDILEERAVALEDLLANTIQSSRDERGSFANATFFDKWFREEGAVYYFLFKKNLKVTNIQFAELLALLRSHTRIKATSDFVDNLQFVSVSDFNEALRSLVLEIESDRTLQTPPAELIARLYSPVLRNQIVIESFFGSCAVFIPPHLTIDLAAICAYSGYIHSCGRSVFIRKVDKTTKKEFFDAVDRHLVRSQDTGGGPEFIVYAHEDFTPYDREMEGFLRDGLDDLKFHIEKFYLDSQRFVGVLKEMREQFKGRLIIPDPGDFRRQTENREKLQSVRSKTIWLLIDNSVGHNPRTRGEDRYFVCYEQSYVNENPFHLFDENKPAWIAPTTIPHTLLGAMLNITGVSSARHERVIVADPFSGTGTTWLETLKYPGVLPMCSDLDPVVPMVAAHNLEFFQATSKRLRELAKQLRSIPGHATPKMPAGIAAQNENSHSARAYNEAIALMDQGAIDATDASFTFSPSVTKALRRMNMLERLCFYLALRTSRRNIAAFERNSIDWVTRFKHEADVLAAQIENLCSLRDREKRSAEHFDNFSIFQGRYSASCSIKYSALCDAHSAEKGPLGLNTQNALNLEPDSCDVVVTDPPYGFNTEDEPYRLAELYAAVIPVLVKALRNQGQLVICLPDRSHIGRRSYFFTHKELVTQQVLAAADTANREVVSPSSAVPRHKELFRPPYYWESERALRRAILHFEIRDRRNE